MESDKQQVAKKLEYINILRGLAVLMVILVHTAQRVQGLHSIAFTIARYGQMGVQLFFILSAYTLCLSMEKRGTSEGLMPFYLRRYFRIAPLYYFGILLYAFYNSVLELGMQNFSLKNIAANLLLVHGLYFPANNNVVPGGWSIGAEMIFYGIFPFLFQFYRNNLTSRGKIIAASVIGLVVCYVAVQTIAFYTEHDTSNNAFLYFSIINQLPVFLLGLSYYFYSKVRNGEALMHPFLTIGGFVAFTAGALVLFVYDFHITLTPFVSGLSFLFLIETIKNVRAIKIRALSKIGQLSYSMYLFHFVFAWYVSGVIFRELHPYLGSELILAVCYLVTIGGTALVAMWSEKTIERYGILLGNKIILNMGFSLQRGENLR